MVNRCMPSISEGEVFKLSTLIFRREKLEVELAELHNSEMWQAGKTVRSLRPENQPGK